MINMNLNAWCPQKCPCLAWIRLGVWRVHHLARMVSMPTMKMTPDTKDRQHQDQATAKVLQSTNQSESRRGYPSPPQSVTNWKLLWTSWETHCLPTFLSSSHWSWCPVSSSQSSWGTEVTLAWSKSSLLSTLIIINQVSSQIWVTQVWSRELCLARIEDSWPWDWWDAGRQEGSHPVLLWHQVWDGRQWGQDTGADGGHGASR